MIEILDELHMLSDILDVGGFTLEANTLDIIMKKIAIEQKINRPWLREVSDLVGKIDDMLSDNQKVSSELRNELISDLNKYLLNNEDRFKESAPASTSHLLPENVIVANLKNLFAEIGKAETETLRNKDLDLMAKEMNKLRLMDISGNEKEQDKAKYIRNELGDDTIKGIEKLLQTRASQLNINELVLPEVMLKALDYYKSLGKKKSWFARKLHQQDAELKIIKEELSKQDTRYIEYLTPDGVQKASQDARELINKKDKLEDSQKFYRTEMHKIDDEIIKTRANIKIVLMQLQMVAGGNAEAAEEIRQAVGYENLKELINIGDANEQEDTKASR